MGLTLTRDPDFPVEIFNLIQAFNAAAGGHRSDHVLEAACNLVVGSINMHAQAMTNGVEPQATQAAMTIAAHIAQSIPEHVRFQRERKPTPADIPAHGAN